MLQCEILLKQTLSQFLDLLSDWKLNLDNLGPTE